MLEVLLRAKRVLMRLGVVREHGRKLVIERIHLENPPGLRLGDLLLEERMEDDRGAAAVFEAADGIQAGGERRGARDEWTGQAQAQVSSGEVDGAHTGRGSTWRATTRPASEPDIRTGDHALGPQSAKRGFLQGGSRINSRQVGGGRPDLVKMARQCGISSPLFWHTGCPLRQR